MRVFLAILSLLWIAIGCALILYTGQTRDFFKRLFPGVSIRRLALIPAAIGLLLLAGAFSTPGLFWLLFILGLLVLAKGAFLGFGPMSRIEDLLQWWYEQAGETTIRFGGIIVLLLGVAVFSCVFRY